LCWCGVAAQREGGGFSREWWYQTVSNESERVGSSPAVMYVQVGGGWKGLGTFLNGGSSRRQGMSTPAVLFCRWEVGL
jgi:hypothetical protein